MRCLSKLTLNQKLGVLALALGALAVFANVAPGHTVTVNAKELLTGVERQEDHVTPAELAAWIIEGRTDYRLVDIRDEKAFAEYHIPTAENVPLATVTDGSLGRTDKIVLYGDGGIHAAQAWMVLEGQGLHAGLHPPRGPRRLEGRGALPRHAPEPDGRAAGAVRAGGAGREVLRRPAARGHRAGLRARGAADRGRGPGRAPPTLPAGAGTGPKKKREGC